MAGLFLPQINNVRSPGDLSASVCRSPGDLVDGWRDSSFPRDEVCLCVCLYGTSSLRMGGREAITFLLVCKKESANHPEQRLHSEHKPCSHSKNRDPCTR